MSISPSQQVKTNFNWLELDLGIFDKYCTEKTVVKQPIFGINTFNCTAVRGMRMNVISSCSGVLLRDFSTNVYGFFLWRFSRVTPGTF